MDLRFVPDEMAFEDEARDEADEVPALYKGLDFVTDVSRRSCVRVCPDPGADALPPPPFCVFAEGPPPLVR
jgi:hypothetical protein